LRTKANTQRVAAAIVKAILVDDAARQRLQRQVESAAAVSRALTLRPAPWR